jgi:hypothetical protein
MGVDWEERVFFFCASRTVEVARVGQRHDELELQREALLLRGARRRLRRARLLARTGRHALVGVGSGVALLGTRSDLFWKNKQATTSSNVKI